MTDLDDRPTPVIPERPTKQARDAIRKLRLAIAWRILVSAFLVAFCSGVIFLLTQVVAALEEAATAVEQIQMQDHVECPNWTM